MTQQLPSIGSNFLLQGDSGGPLIHRETGKQVGIVSFGEGCARPNSPGGMAHLFIHCSKFIDLRVHFLIQCLSFLSIRTCVTGTRIYSFIHIKLDIFSSPQT